MTLEYISYILINIIMNLDKYDFKGSYVINRVRVQTFEHKANGMMVTLIPIPGETVAINLVNKFGSASECVKAKTGSLHLLEHLYFRIGKLNKSIDHSAFALSVKTGAYQNAQTTSSSMELVTHSHVKYENEVFKLFADRMQDSYIDPACKVAEEQAVFNEAQRSLKSPYMQVISHMSKIAMDGGSGYAWMTIGTIDDVANVTAQELMDLKEYFSKPENTHIVVSGAVSANTLDHIHENFGHMERSKTPIQRPGLKPADPQVSMRQASVVVDSTFPVIAIGFHSPKRQPFEFTDHDLMLRIVEKAVDRPEVQQVMQGFVNTSVFNPEYVAPYLFTFLSCPQTDPSMFPQVIQQALSKIKNMPEEDLRTIVHDLKYKIENSMTSAHAATEMIADAVSTMKWDTIKSIHSKYCAMLKPNYSIQNELSGFIDNYFKFDQSTFIIGCPRQQVQSIADTRMNAQPLANAELDTRIQLKSSHASKVSVIKSTHNMAVVQKTSPDVYINASIPFRSDVQLKQEAMHTLLANVLNAVPMPASASASTRRSYSAGHDVFHISMKMRTSGGVKDIVDQFKSPDFSMFDNIKVTSASMARGEMMNATALAKVAAINSIYKQSPFTHYEGLPDQIQNITVSDLKSAHDILLSNLKNAYFTLTGDWSDSGELENYKGKLESHLSANFSPITGSAKLKSTGQDVDIIKYAQSTNMYHLDINGEQHTVEPHQITNNTIPPFQWVAKPPKEGWEHKELSSIATATVMYAVSFPKEKKRAMEFVMNMFGDSMSGWTMQKVRWEECEQCYGINGQTVSTNTFSPPLAVLVGTVGAEALERAKVDVQATIHQHAGKITQEQLDTTFARMEGEMVVKHDYADDIHSIVHSDLVSGNKPTLEVTKPSLKEVNEASLLLYKMAKVEVVPTSAPSTITYSHQRMSSDDEDEYNSDIEFYL